MSRRTEAHDLPTPPGCQLLIEEARAAERVGQHGVARARYEEALRRLSRPEHASAAAALLRWVGGSYRAEGDGEAAMDCYEASLAVAELNDDSPGIAHALNWIGIGHREWGHLDRADGFFRQARSLAEAAEDPSLLAMVDQNMGVVAGIQGDLHRALQHYQCSLERYREVGEEASLGSVLNNLGMLYIDLRRWEEAERLFDESDAICERVDDPYTRVMVEVNRAELFYCRGDLSRARESCDAAFDLANRLEYRSALGEIYKWKGIICRETGKYKLAETHLTTAAELAERYTNPLLAGEAQRELARVYRAQDRDREALQALNYAHRVFSELRARIDLADVDRRIGELEELYLQVVRKWGESIESKDRYTAGHCQRVADYACMLAATLGYDAQTITWFRMGAFLHDVGKVVVSPRILNKEGPLSPEEWGIMRRHTIAGVELLSAIEFPWDVRPMVRSHHEHWDGGGYPDRLKGREIPLPARILCVADAFDALTTTRSYREAFSPERALEVMEEDSGRIFDPEIFALFRRLMEERTEAVPAPAAD